MEQEERRRVTVTVSVLDVLVFIVMVSVFGFASVSANHLIGPPPSSFITMGGKITDLIVQYEEGEEGGGRGRRREGKAEGGGRGGREALLMFVGAAEKCIA